MRGGDFLVVAAEEAEEVAGQIVFVGIVQTAHDAEIKRDIFAVACHLDVAGVHIGMKEAIAEHLGEEYLHAIACQLRDADTGFT